MLRSSNDVLMHVWHEKYEYSNCLYNVLGSESKLQEMPFSSHPG